MQNSHSISETTLGLRSLGMQIEVLLNVVLLLSTTRNLHQSRMAFNSFMTDAVIIEKPVH